MAVQGTLMSNDVYERKNRNPRNQFYKRPIKKDNYKLDVEDEECPQEIRRQKLLCSQKKNRDAAFNAGRAILDACINSDEESLESMEVDKKNSETLHRYKQFTNKLMMSEWMLEVPEDYLEKWLIVPCPEGRRTLVVACKGKTKAYSRRGERLGRFNSALPGGNSNEQNKSCTILDCIWLAKEKTYYALDVLAWSNQPLLNCDAEFRLYWLKSKLADMSDLQMRNATRNTFPILPLPYASCTEEPSEIIEKSLCLKPLDGFLFFHREGQYTNGRTPLVTWLKPFMLNEVLGITIPMSLEEKPDGYIDCQHYMESQKSRPRPKKVVQEMDVVDIDT
ncbi:snurportin-1 isoform X2 [Venturia canescens]|nr:snurportin-1 isoform X2 [Venturia canescens]